MSFDVLPTEVLQTIFRLQRWRDLKNKCLVCRRWADAAEPILVARSCLAISHSSFSEGFGTKLAPVNRQECRDDKLVQLIDVLSKSNRNYTCLRIKWDKTITERQNKTLKKIIKMCKEQFSPQELHLDAFSCKTLTKLFKKPCNWLENLTELHFEQSGTMTSESTIGISLPKLKRLTWLEEERREVTDRRHRRDMTTPEMTPSSFQSAILDVPELEYLKVKLGIENTKSQKTKDCSLFLPNLQLKSCSKLQRVEMVHSSRLDQKFLVQNKEFWQNLKSLTFSVCSRYVTETIFEMCSNLQELSIQRAYEPIVFENISVLSRSLKELTLNDVRIWFGREEVTFSELQSISFINTNDKGGVHLIAPKLTKVFISGEEFELLAISEQETGTTAIHLDPLSKENKVYLPNVNELCIIHAYPWQTQLVHDYLNSCPNLRRLTIEGTRAIHGRLELDVKNFPNLEYLCGARINLRLADFHELIHLETLELVECKIIVKLDDDGEVVLTTLKNIRLQAVAMAASADRTWDHFPLKGSYLQSSIVKTSAKGFSSPEVLLLRKPFILKLPERIVTESWESENSQTASWYF